MTERLAVGTPVTVNTSMYGGMHGNDDLVVLSLDCNPAGYGIGSKGNDPSKAHSSRDGWLYYPASYVTPKEESKAVTKFNKGDKVRYNNPDNPAWHGVEAIVEVEARNTYSNVGVRLTKGATGWASSYKTGDTAKIGTHYLELIEDKPLTLNGFAVGDKVRYTKRLWKNLEGIVSSINGEWIDVMVTKLPDYPSKFRSVKVGKTLTEACGGMGIDTFSLEKIEEPTKAKTSDFKAGDRVEFVEHYFQGATTGTKATVVSIVDEDFVKVRTDAGEDFEPFPWRLKKIEEPAALKAGDKVVVDLDTTHSSWHKAEGVLVEPRSSKLWRVQITKVGPNNKGYYAVGQVHTLTGLTVLPPFTFKDIQKGDTIRRTKTYKSGATEVREGVAAKRGSYYWADESNNFIIVYEDESDNVTLELLNRPEPEPVKPTLLENSKIGDRISIVDRKSIVKLYTKTHGDSWGTLVYPNNTAQPHTGFTWSTWDVEQEAAREDATYTLLPA